MMKSTTQGNLQVLTDELLLYYNIGNINSYTYSSPETNRLYNLAKSKIKYDYLYNKLEIKSGRQAILNNVTYEKGNQSNLPSPFDNILTIGVTGYIELPTFDDLELYATDYSIEIFFKLGSLSTNNPPSENYIIKSYGNDGLYIQYNPSDDRYLDVGSSGGGTHSYITEIQPSGNYYQFVFTYSRSSDDLSIYYNATNEIRRKKSSLWDTFSGPVKIAYGFDSIEVSQIKLYSKCLTDEEIKFNLNQFKTFRLV